MDRSPTKRKLWSVVALTTLLLALVAFPPWEARSQVGTQALQACARMAFSTEEDFVTRGPEPPDGNPIISDGDLLSPDGVVCARNQDLLQAFKVTKDLGLDAVDILSVEDYLVAFSTELDDPTGRFTAGDLLTTHGAVIANVALTHRFEIGYDIGLDALHFVGDLEAIVAFLKEVQGISRDYWLRNPSALGGMLDQYRIDIWFSTEGTAPTPGRPRFLDGDLLSARSGTIVLSNKDLLPNTVPAGIPDRGVDFGLDAFASRSRDPGKARALASFSTEILFWPGDRGLDFTDGDVLKVGDGVDRTNYDLIKNFRPATTELGLDALFLVSYAPPPECYAALTDLGGTKAPIADLNPVDGTVSLGYPTRHPFAWDVPFWGHLASCVTRFRVVYRPLGDTGDGTPILPGTWTVGDPATWDPTFMQCMGTMPRPSPDAQGYYNAAEFQQLRLCNDLPLTNWNTKPLSPAVATYEVRLDYEVGGVIQHGPWYRVKVDNEMPVIDRLKLLPKPGSSGGGTGDCPIYTTANMPLTLQGQFHDDHFWSYQAFIDGDLYPAHAYTYTTYYAGTPEAANLDDTGTTPDGTLVNLHPVDVRDIVPNPAACCYSVRVRVWDRAIWGTFYGYKGLVSGQVGRWVEEDVYFAYQP